MDIRIVYLVKGPTWLREKTNDFISYNSMIDKQQFSALRGIGRGLGIIFYINEPVL